MRALQVESVCCYYTTGGVYQIVHEFLFARHESVVRSIEHTRHVQTRGMTPDFHLSHDPLLHDSIGGLRGHRAVSRDLASGLSERVE